MRRFFASLRMAEDVPGMPGRGDREMMINGGNR